MRPWQFSRPKGPGYGISRSFYLSVLCAGTPLPSILHLVNPKGEAGAAEGFGAPLAAGADKSILSQPLQRGTYAVATKDRKTVLRMLVLARDEAGYDPEAFAASPLAAGADPELLARMRGTWNLVQFSYESHDPDVFPALDFLLGVSARLAMLADGVIADPIARRYRLPHEVFVPDRLDPRIDARDHIAVAFRPDITGFRASTAGMAKFALPEYEIGEVSEPDEALATRFLIALSQRVLLGDLTASGDHFGAPKSAFEAREAVGPAAPIFELLPPTGKAPHACLTAWDLATRAN